MQNTPSYKAICDTLAEQLSAACGQSERPAANVLRPLFQDFAANGFDVLYGAIFRNPEVLEQLAAQSFEHHNGFLKLTLVEACGGRFRLRLHQWERTETLPPSRSPSIHNHRFSFYSLLLFGTLSHCTWTRDDNGTEYGHYLYHSRDGSERYVLQYVGRASLSASPEIEYTAKDCYYFPNDALHTSFCTSSSAATLFLEDRSALRSHADVFSRKYPRMDASVSAVSLGPDAYLSALRALIRAAPR